MTVASYSGAMPSTMSIRTVPRICSTLYGGVVVSMDSATVVPSRSAFSLGASGGVPSTTSLPFQ
jgi:hypothetical protein